MRGLWDRFTGNHSQIKKQNEAEVYQSMISDRQEKDTLIHKQLEQRQTLQRQFERLRDEREADLAKLKEAVFSKMPEEKIRQFEQNFQPQERQHDQNFDLEM